MIRASLYARYSTDRQRETSIDDQLRAARERARREGWQVVAQHSDEGISGSTPVALRPGGKALLADALAGRFDVLILEGLDRLSRELGEAETMVKRLEHRGVRIIGTSDGYDSQAHGRKVMRIARGLVNELYLDDLREKTHRGLAGNFDRGMSAGGRSFGYRTEATQHGQRLVIEEAEAAVVREVFELYADGHSPRAIAHQLNQRAIPTARGRTWGASAIQGHAGRGEGVLHNALYVGKVIWNRRQWIKDPDTGARRYVPRPESEWQVRQDESLRIVPQSVWDKVQARSTAGPARGTRTGKGAIPRTLFGGLLRCHQCGGPLIGVSANRYGCNINKDRGPAACANNRTVRRDLVDRRLVADIRDLLAAPESVADLQAAVRAVVAAQRKAAAAASESVRKRITQLDGELGRLIDAVATIGASQALAERIRAAEVERADLMLQVQAPSDASHLLAEVTARYRRMLLDLETVLADEERDRTRAILAEIVGPVTIVHEGTAVYAELQEPADRLLVAAGGRSLGMVAGARNSSRRRLRVV
jgi:DNA invertase Pin-like site-specific DNA recombinase